jgi:hypothetical protein
LSESSDDFVLWHAGILMFVEDHKRVSASQHRRDRRTPGQKIDGSRGQLRERYSVCSIP